MRRIKTLLSSLILVVLISTISFAKTSHQEPTRETKTNDVVMIEPYHVLMLIIPAYYIASYSLVISLERAKIEAPRMLDEIRRTRYIDPNKLTSGKIIVLDGKRHDVLLSLTYTTNEDGIIAFDENRKLLWKTTELVIKSYPYSQLKTKANLLDLKAKLKKEFNSIIEKGKITDVNIYINKLK